MSDFIVGLTGGIAAGKSEVSRRFEALGIVVADADLAAREVVAPGSPALEQIANHFGAQVLLSDGTLDRAQLRERVFASTEARQLLESITHPAIRKRVREICEAATSPYAIAAIPLLAEAGGRQHYPWLDRILVVDAPEPVQHARLMQRDGIDAELADRMIAAQTNREQRLALADDVISNDGDPAHLDEAVRSLDARYRAFAAAMRQG
ncbi:dephospho-CoA kinase [Flavobacterium sp. MXW15]|uniref:Dephospho-CoA kinase n=1 Tax=Xanthomonas chitinilytica TaxID=2989819 RepID=A0ABT3JTX3_9XANT|nr:dephospho-CoA kinase [Xanthomonas sp. H13-6]MCW4454706.1 dephospho-CoA kinase [Flavobacterium sp. MXW15]MCW4471945.1 dephospho-CoA kinase [Xanthomonas sp. H13-6]